VRGVREHAKASERPEGALHCSQPA
jgi:hypothetical protein